MLRSSLLRSRRAGLLADRARRRPHRWLPVVPVRRKSAPLTLPARQPMALLAPPAQPSTTLMQPPPGMPVED